MSYKSIYHGIIVFIAIVGATTTFAASPQWEPVVLDFTASDSIVWYNFPLQVTFSHEGSGTQITLDGYWDGENSWKVRFAPPLSGIWNWQSASSDNGLSGKNGTINVTPLTDAEKNNNANLRGHLKMSSDHRRLEYADGTPFFWLGDTNWHINDDRCGVTNRNFYTYVNNRKAKKFNTIQIQYFSRLHYNEGGYPIPGNTGAKSGNGTWHPINPEYFQYVDVRMDYLFQQGFVVAGHPRWISNDKITLTWARRTIHYLMARYGAYNTVWSLTGEYQFSRNNSYSLTPPYQWNQLGNYVQTINPYNHPVTIHPTFGSPNYITGQQFSDYSSSGEFHSSPWLDINWIQTYAWIEDVSESVYSDYLKTPIKPVISAEPAYESYISTPVVKQTYNHVDATLVRLQAWSAILCGAAGHTYGAVGIWQFYDPNHPQPGHSANNNGLPWYDQIEAEGGADMQHLRTFFDNSNFDWTALVPHRDWLRVNGSTPPWPHRTDFSPPHCAAQFDQTYIIYIPTGNRGKSIAIRQLNNNAYTAKWYNPRNGNFTNINNGPDGVDQWELPPRPDGNDWVLLLTAEKELPLTSPKKLRLRKVIF